MSGNNAANENSNSKCGYCNPPEHTKFKKGKSGNPKGRPVGAKSIATYVKEELQSKMTGTKNGKICRMPKAQYLAKIMVAGAMRMELPLLNRVLAIDEQFSLLQDSEPEIISFTLKLEEDPPHEDDRASHG